MAERDMTANLLDRHPSILACARSTIQFVVALAALSPLSILAEDFVVIMNRDNPNKIDRAYVAKIYTGTLKGWPDGTLVAPLDQDPQSEVRQSFYATIVGKSPANMRAIWSQNIFTGKALPPKVTYPDAEMKRAIAANRNAIGYIRASQLDGSVAVVGK